MDAETKRQYNHIKPITGEPVTFIPTQTVSDMLDTLETWGISTDEVINKALLAYKEETMTPKLMEN